MLRLVGLLPMIFGLIRTLLPIIDKLIPDRTLAMQLQNAIKLHVLDNEGTAIAAFSQIAQTDSRSEHWYTYCARPTVTYWIILLVTGLMGLSYFDPHGAAVMTKELKQIPSELWTMMSISLGSYFLGRSLEKVFK